MTEDQVADAVAAWVQAVLPELNAARSWLSASKTELPDVMVDVAEKSIALRDDRFPRIDFQQAAIRVFEVEFALMVEHTTGLDRDKQETEQLRDFGSRLEASLLSDGTLGGRVFMASPLLRIDYRLPFVQYEDGTRGRQSLVTLAVGEPVKAES